MRSIQLSYGRVLYSPARARCVGKRISRVLSPARRPEADHFSGTAIAGGLKQPTRDPDGAAPPSPLFGLAPGGVCLAAPVASRAVVSYTTVSPLPVPSPSRGRVIGGLFSVALSVASRRPAVSRHPALRSSDFPQRLPLPGKATSTLRSTLASRVVNQPTSPRPRPSTPPSPSEPQGSGSVSENRCEFRRSKAPRTVRAALLRHAPRTPQCEPQMRPSGLEPETS
jgi:hypothetical protein